MDKVVIVGASLAGVHAAEALREHGYSGSITLVDQHVGPVHDRPPLSKGALSGKTPLSACVLRPESWAKEFAIDYLGGRSVVGLDTDSRFVTLEGGSRLPFDGLVIATGLRPRPAPWLPAGTPGLHLVRTDDDAQRLGDEMRSASSVVVVGGGFLGLEVASTARSLGLDVTVVEYESSLLSRVLPPELGEWFANVHRRNGVAVRTDTAVIGVQESQPGLTVRLSDGDEIETELLVVALGAEPVTEWLTGSGIEIDDGVVCNADLSTSVGGVVAAGDVVRWPHPETGKCVRLEHWTNAVEQGRHAAGTLLGANEPFRCVPYFWTDQFDARARFVGWVSPTHEIFVKSSHEDSLVVAFGDRDELQGALCVNEPKELAAMRRLIDQGTAWSEVADGDAKTDNVPTTDATRTVTPNEVGGMDE